MAGGAGRKHGTPRSIERMWGGTLRCAGGGARRTAGGGGAGVMLVLCRPCLLPCQRPACWPCCMRAPLLPAKCKDLQSIRAGSPQVASMQNNTSQQTLNAHRCSSALFHRASSCTGPCSPPPELPLPTLLLNFYQQAVPVGHLPQPGLGQVACAVGGRARGRGRRQSVPPVPPVAAPAAARPSLPLPLPRVCVLFRRRLLHAQDPAAAAAREEKAGQRGLGWDATAGQGDRSRGEWEHA